MSRHALTAKIGDTKLVATIGDQELILRCMIRLLHRYDELYARQLYCVGEGELHPKEKRDWFKARYDHLHEEFVVAINASDQIIGKQWHYDYYIKKAKWGSR